MLSTDSRRRRPLRRRTRRWSAALVVVVALTATACASTTAPRGFLPDPVRAQTDAYGSWIDVILGGDAGTERVMGELIAIDDDTTWVLSDDGLLSFGTSRISRGQLVTYDSRAGSVGGGAVIGLVSTISNGVLLIVTAPLWIITGSVAAAQQSRAPIEDATRETPASFARFARFPGGLPDGLDPQTLEGGPTLQRRR